MKLKLPARYIGQTRVVAFALLAALMLFTFAAGCSKPAADEVSSSQPMEESSDEVNLEYPVSVFGASLGSRPGKVVTLSPALTEKLIDLGLADRLEGISDADDSLPERVLPRIGTAQLVDIDQIAVIAPHLLLTEAELPQEILDTLGGMNVAVATVPHAGTIDELKENYTGVAKLLEGDRSGGELGTAVGRRIDQKLDELEAKKPGEIKNAVYIRLLDYNVATGDTLESRMMESIGLRNIAENQTGWIYPEADANSTGGLEDFKAIDFIFCDKRSVAMKTGLEKSAFWKGINAVRKDYYLYIDDTAFERQSMRMFDELNRMQQYILGEIPSSKEEESASGS